MTHEKSKISDFCNSNWHNGSKSFFLLEGYNAGTRSNSAHNEWINNRRKWKIFCCYINF